MSCERKKYVYDNGPWRCYTLVSDLVTVYLSQLLSYKCNKDMSVLNQKGESEAIKRGNENFARRTRLSKKFTEAFTN